MFTACDLGAERIATQPDFRQLLEKLYQDRSLVSFTSGQTIPLHPQSLWVVSRGAVQLTLLYPNGEEALLGIAGSAMPFGAAFSRMHPYQAIALTDVALMPLSLEEVERSPELVKGLYPHLVRRLSQTEALLAISGHRRVEDRLRDLLRLLGQEFGQVHPDGVCLTVRLTHQHLANAIGTTRVTVTRLLGFFRQEGWLKVTHDRYLLLQEPPSVSSPQ